MKNLTKYQLEDIRNHAILFNKWIYKDPVPLDTPMEYHYSKGINIINPAHRKKKIAIWCGPAWEPWNRDKVDSGMAGSETWAAELGAEFSRRGYEVTIFNDPVEDGEKDKDGVVYRDYRKYNEAVAYDYLDVFIASRTCEPFSMNLHARQKFCMIHDIWISPDPNYNKHDWQVVKYAYLSEWHRLFLMQHHKIAPNKLMPTINGVNQNLYEDVDLYKKKNQTVWSSSPDRGLKELLVMLPEIRKKVPDLEIKVAYGFHNWESAAKVRNNQDELKEIDTLKKMMNQPGVEYLGRIDKKTLAKLQMESKVHLMPVWFSETFGIGWVENSLSKNALLTSDYAGIQTTVGSSGILLDGFGPYGGPHPQEYRDKFISESVKLLTDENYRQIWADKAYQNSLKFTWQNCADMWIKEFGW